MTYETQLWYSLAVSSRFSAMRHICFIALFLIMIFNGPPVYRQEVNLLIGLAFAACFLAVLYLNMYLFVPRLLIKGRFYWYFGCVLGTGLITAMLSGYAQHSLAAYRILPVEQKEDLLGFLVVFIIIIAASSAIKLFQHWIKHIEHFYKVQHANFKNELTLLKNQINPHFLFNTLNNAHVLITADPPRASSLLVSLSDLLRYQIYDCGHEFIFLSADIQFVRNFLALESARREEFTFEVTRTGDPHDILLPPLLFIPFIENAVKHNHDWHAPSYVKTTIHLHEKLLTFTCINSKPLNHEVLPKTHGGIGLSNIKKRLSLLFPDKHTLLFEEKDTTYFVKLEIHL